MDSGCDVDESALRVVTADTPSTSDQPNVNYGYGRVEVRLDGTFLGSAYLLYTPGQGAITQSFSFIFSPLGGALLPPGTDTSHVMTARVMHGCGGTGQDYTFKSLRIEVISIG